MAITYEESRNIINESLALAGYQFQIPKVGDAKPDGTTVTDSDVEKAWQTLGAYAPTQKNEIMEQMNLVVQQRNYAVMFDSSDNKFRSFVVGMTDEGFGLEDLFHELIEGSDPLWDDKSDAATAKILNDLVSYDTNKISKAFHTKTFSRIFKTTIDRRNYDKVFLRTYANRYIDTKLANMQWSAEVYLQDEIINVVREMISKNHIVFKYASGSEPFNVNNDYGLRNFIEDVKTTTDGFMTTTELYNLGVPEFDNAENIIKFRQVRNKTNSIDDIFILTTPSLWNRAKVQGYSNAFNLSQYQLDGRVIFVPEGNGENYPLGVHAGKPVLAVALDRRAILAGIKRWDGTSQFIPNVHRFNNWLAVEGIEGYNTFFNAVAFVGEPLDTFEEKEYATYIINNSGYSVTVNGVEYVTGKIDVIYGAKEIVISVDPFTTGSIECYFEDIKLEFNGEGVATIKNGFEKTTKVDCREL